MLIMAAVLLPPVTKLIDQKWKFHLSRGLKIVVIIIGLIIFGATVDTSNVSNTQQAESQKEEQQATQNEEVGDETVTTEPVNEEQLQNETNEQANDKEKIETIPVLFDVSALLDKNISYFTPVFGEPVNENSEPTDVAIQTGVETWIKRFEKDGYTIAVTYNINSGNVTEIFLSKGTYDMPLEKTVKEDPVEEKPFWYGKPYKITTIDKHEGREDYDIGLVNAWSSYDNRSSILFKLMNNESVLLTGYDSEHDYCQVKKDKQEGWIACGWVQKLPSNMIDYWDK